MAGDLDNCADRSCFLQAANPKDQYLLLKALNEVIVSLTSDMGNKQLSPSHQQEVCAPHSAVSSYGLAPTGCCPVWEISHIAKACRWALSRADSFACGQVLRLLLANCEVEEECRNVVAECMGHLALLFPAEVLPALLQRQSDPSPSARGAAVTAIKSAVVPEPQPIDDLLKNSIEAFLALVSDPDRHDFHPWAPHVQTVKPSLTECDRFCTLVLGPYNATG